MSGTIPNQFKPSSSSSTTTTTKPTSTTESEEESEDDDRSTTTTTTSNHRRNHRRVVVADGGGGGGGDNNNDNNVASEEEQDDDYSTTSSRPTTTTTTSVANNTSVQVALRIRPLLPREQIANARECITVAEKDPQVWIAGTHAFTYDQVFKTTTAQEDVFTTVAKPLVDGILEGYNATILAYGQTGSGKTYTMGTGFDTSTSDTTTTATTQGLLPRCISYLFSKIETLSTSTPSPDFNITVQFTELYNEEVIDLLARPTTSSSARSHHRPTIKIQEKSSGEIYLVNITSKPVVSTPETLSVLRDGALNRTTASTNMNDSSSRSHAIFTLSVCQNRIIRDRSTGGNDIETLHGKFHFVDLAGSERLKRTLATGERAREGIAINSGLLALGNVISALGDKTKKSSHVPYRDSKLTRLLQDSLGGNSRTLMIACVSPNEIDFVETLNTMKYANRAKNIKNKVVVNQDKSSRTITLLREEIARLTSELQEVKRGISRTSNAGGAGGGGGVVESTEFGDCHAENIMLLSEVETLRCKVKSKQDTIDKLTSQLARLQATIVTGATTTSSSSSSSSPSSSCDLTTMVSKYLTEIQDLRSKLYESESECEKLRAKQRVIIKNLTNGSPGKDIPLLLDSSYSDVGQLIKSARSEVASMQASVIGGKSRRKKEEEVESNDDDDDDDVNEDDEDDEEEEDEEDDDDEDDDDDDEEEREDNTGTQNYTELANLTQEINTKQRLIEELENSQLRLESLKNKYEEKITQLSNKIKSTEEERDALMKRKPSSSSSSSNASSDKNLRYYENKIKELTTELKKWDGAKKEHAKQMKKQVGTEAQLLKLKNEVEDMKRTKVKLMNQVKNENTKFREMEKARLKEISQLRKESRMKEVRVKKLESDSKMKDAVLKRKLEEVESLKKSNRVGNRRGGGGGRLLLSGGSTSISGKAGGVSSSSSPVKGKAAWTRIHEDLIRDVNSRCNVSSLEREMVNLIARRSELHKSLEVETDADTIDSITVNLRILEEKIESLQEDIVCANEIFEKRGGIISNRIGGRIGGRGSSSSSSSSSRPTGMLVEKDYNYVFDKLYEQSFNSLSEVTNMEARVNEVEEVNRTLRTEVDTLRNLLHHMYVSATGTDPNQYHHHHNNLILPYLESHVSSSSSSSSSSKALMPPPPQPPPPPPQPSNNTNNNKARRRLTSTPKELLLGSSVEDLSSNSSISSINNHHQELLSLNNRSAAGPSSSSSSFFTRNTRLTQSLRGGGKNNKKVPLMRQDTYSVDNNNLNRTFVVDDGGREGLMMMRSNEEQTSGVVGCSASSSSSSSSNLMNNPNKQSSGGAVAAVGVVVPNTTNNVVARIQRSVSEINRGGSGGDIIRNSKTSSSTTSSYPRNNSGGSSNPLTLTTTLEGHTKPILCLTSSETTLVSGSKDGTARVWDLETRSEICCYDNHPHNVSCLCYVPEMNLLMTGSSYQIRIYDLRSNVVVKAFTSLSTPLNPSSMTQPQNQIIPILNTTIPRVNDLPPKEKRICFIQKVGNNFFTSLAERTRVWDLRKLQNLGVLGGKHSAGVMCATGREGVSSSSDYLVTGSKDHSVKVYQFDELDKTNSTSKNLSPVHYDGVECLWFSRNGKWLVSGSRDTNLKKYSVAEGFKSVGQCSSSHNGWVTGVTGVEVDNNEEVIATCSKDGAVKIWDISGRETFVEVGKWEGSSPIDCIWGNSKLLFFGGGNSISNNNYDNNSSSSGIIGLYKLSESFVRNYNSGGGVNIGARGSGGSSTSSSSSVNNNNNNNFSSKTQYLNND